MQQYAQVPYFNFNNSWLQKKHIDIQMHYQVGHLCARYVTLLVGGHGLVVTFGSTGSSLMSPSSSSQLGKAQHVS